VLQQFFAFIKLVCRGQIQNFLVCRDEKRFKSTAIDQAREANLRREFFPRVLKWVHDSHSTTF